jgi:steroid 5-alpha reductase family enzyme
MLEQVCVQTACWILVFQTIAFFFALLFKRNDIADVCWGAGFVMIVVTLFLHHTLTPPAAASYLLTIFWGGRLSIHLFLRNKNKQEDFRYRAWRETWGKHFVWRSFLQVFLLQGFFMWLISLPIQITAIDEKAGWNVWIWAGILVWLIGFYFQATADAQLKKFMTHRKKGEILQTGLWKYSRHPNYFGEILMWWGIGIIAGPLEHGWLGWIGPLTITWLLAKVSGVPMLERKYRNHPEFEEYKSRTPALLPNFRQMIADMQQK